VTRRAEEGAVGSFKMTLPSLRRTREKSSIKE
jgi:hypothetical protein